jgi:heterodisulfide reductase subunit B
MIIEVHGKMTMSNSKTPSEKYGYFLGCVMPAKMPWAEKSTMLVAKHLGLDFDYMRETLCCVRPGPWKTIDPDAWLTLTGQNLALAEKQNVTLVDTCNGCWQTHYEVSEELREDPEKMEMVRRHLDKYGLVYTGKGKVRHFLQVLRGCWHRHNKKQGQAPPEHQGDAARRLSRKEARQRCHAPVFR